MKHKLLSFTVLIFLCGFSAAPPKNNNEDALRSQKFTKEQAERPSHVIRPGTPVTVESNMKRAQPNTPISATIKLKALEPCVRLQSSVRGMDGIIVHDGELMDHGACNPDQVQERAVIVNAPSGVAGYVVVDITVTDSAGEVTNTSEMLVMQSKDSEYRNAKVDHKNGTVSKDHEGQGIVIMKSKTN